MNIEEIKKNAPDGAEFYLQTLDIVTYIKKKNGDWCIYHDDLSCWCYEVIPKFIQRHFKPL